MYQAASTRHREVIYRLLAAIVPDVQCMLEDGRWVFIILLLQLGLTGFSTLAFLHSGLFFTSKIVRAWDSSLYLYWLYWSSHKAVFFSFFSWFTHGPWDYYWMNEWMSRVRVKISVSVRIAVRFSFSDRVVIKLPDVDWVELYAGNPTCRREALRTSGDAGETRWMLWRRATLCGQACYLRYLPFRQKIKWSHYTSTAQLLKCSKAIHWSKSTMKNGNHENRVFYAATVN